MKELYVVKIGGNLLDRPDDLAALVKQLSVLDFPFLLVHGGGKTATQLAEKLGVPQQMKDGRRITDAATLEIATMVYGGLINRQLVALLQRHGKNAIGLSGADGDSVRSARRKNAVVDFGFVGDIEENGVNVSLLETFIENGLVPVFCALTHDGNGQLLNTNADSMAAAIAEQLSRKFSVNLLYLFDKPGVMRMEGDEKSVFTHLTSAEIRKLAEEGIVHAGMLPKLENAAAARRKGVKRVVIGCPQDFDRLIKETENAGTSVGC
jgi:acetylglutamate kinase